MLLTKEVEIKLGARNIKYYEGLGYEIPKSIGVNGNLVVLRGTTITVRVEDLQPYCKTVVDVLCDCCKTHISHIQYAVYTECNHNGIYFCNRCSDIKRKQTCMDKYGVLNTFQIPKAREKAKEAIMEKYGVECMFSVAEIRAKSKQTCLDRYGTEYPSQLPQTKEKMRKTNLEKYGVEYVSQCAEFMKQARQTCVERYGAEWAMMSDKIKEKMIQSFYLHGTQPISSQQRRIYDMLISYYGDKYVKLNYPCGRCSLDIVVVFDDINIDIEYDGAFWHMDADKDRRRDEFVKTQGYRILRIKSSHLIPHFADLVDKIESLRSGEHTYDEMILPDWKTIQNDCKNNQIDIDDESLDINKFN